MHPLVNVLAELARAGLSHKADGISNSNLLYREQRMTRSTSDLGFTCILSAARSGSRLLRRLIATATDKMELPYDANYAWLRGKRGASDLRRDSDVRTQDIHRVERALCAAANTRDLSRVVEKTIANSIRPAYVRALFPDTQFVMLARNPADVIASSVRCWTGEMQASDAALKFKRVICDNPQYALSLGIDRILNRSVWGLAYPGIYEDLKSRSVTDICALQWAWSATSSAKWIRESRLEIPIVLYEHLGDESAMRAALEVWPTDTVSNFVQAAEQSVSSRPASHQLPVLADDVQDRISQAVDEILQVSNLSQKCRQCVESWLETT